MKKEEKEFIPYGEEWKAEMMKWRKADLIELLRKKLMELQKLSNEFEPFPED